MRTDDSSLTYLSCVTVEDVWREFVGIKFFLGERQRCSRVWYLDSGNRIVVNSYTVYSQNPHAPSNRHSRCYRKHELEKKRQYEQRMREIEHASFIPLVLSATSGMANEATVFYKRLASCLATKWDQPYSPTMSWLRCRHTFSLIWSAIQCIRGTHSSYGHAAKSQTPPMDLVISEADFI